MVNVRWTGLCYLDNGMDIKIVVRFKFGNEERDRYMDGKQRKIGNVEYVEQRSSRSDGRP